MYTGLSIGSDHWIGWRSVCLKKEYGGLEIRHMREFNTALLGKWC